LLAWFFLAETLGIPVSECQERVSSAEFTEWMAYFEIKQEEQEKIMKEQERKAKKGVRSLSSQPLTMGPGR